MLGPFEEVMLTGLATDGGLYVPETLPRFSSADIKDMAHLDYSELAFKIMSPFVGGDIPDDDFRQLVDQAYGECRHKAIICTDTSQ